jgi:hypothetical protein
VAALALLVRVLVVLATPQFAPATDASDYDRIAVSLAQTGGFPVSGLTARGGPTAFRPPMFPLALAGVYKLVGTGDEKARWEAGRLLEALLGAASVALICLIALRLWGPGVAFLSGVIAAVYPPLVLVGSSLMSESLFIPLLLAAVLSGLVARERGGAWRWVVLTGVLVALAALTRSNGIVLLVPIGFLVWTGRPRFARRSLRVPLALVASTALALIPWTIRNAHVLHAIVPTSTESGYALAGTYDPTAQHRQDFPAMWIPPVPELAGVHRSSPGLNEAAVSSRLVTIGVDYIEAHPSSLVKTAYWDTVRLFNLGGTAFESWAAKYEAYPRRLADLSVYAFWLLGLVAIGGAFTRAARLAPGAFWWCPAALLLSTVMLIGATRYRSPADPFFVMLAALGLRAAWERFGRLPVPSRPG